MLDVDNSGCRDRKHVGGGSHQDTNNGFVCLQVDLSLCGGFITVILSDYLLNSWVNPCEIFDMDPRQATKRGAVVERLVFVSACVFGVVFESLHLLTNEIPTISTIAALRSSKLWGECPSI